MVEDSLVNLVYGHIFGWRTLIESLLIASVILVSAASLIVFYASTSLQTYQGPIQKGAAVLLGLVGAFWLGRSALGGEDEIVEARARVGNLFLALQLVSIEELEVLLVMVPLILASHALEATIAASVGGIISLTSAGLLRRPFSRFVEGRMRVLKLASGTFLIILGIILFLE